MIAWVKDVGRSIDYLETRKDVDSASVAYYGFSAGGSVGSVILAVERRLKAGILDSGGLQMTLR
jgi:eukaryotic-like serine/threonine-protein kinase